MQIQRIKLAKQSIVNSFSYEQNADVCIYHFLVKSINSNDVSVENDILF